MIMLSSGLLGAARAAGMAPPPSGAGGEAPGIMSYLPMIAMLVAIFYLMMFRPQQKKQQEVKDLLASLKKGDQVVTSGGIHGVVAGVRDDIVVLKVADNVKIEFSKTAIAAVTKREIEPS
jgi:preprotein translocase subunit YajC